MIDPLDDVVERQLRAYNAHDVDAFAACYSEEVLILDADGNELLRGRAALDAQYRPLFEANPDLRAELTGRLRVGRYVVDQERVTAASQADLRAIAIYRLGDDQLIERVQFLM